MIFSAITDPISSSENIICTMCCLMQQPTLTPDQPNDDKGLTKFYVTTIPTRAQFEEMLPVFLLRTNFS